MAIAFCKARPFVVYPSPTFMYSWVSRKDETCSTIVTNGIIAYTNWEVLREKRVTKNAGSWNTFNKVERPVCLY